MQGIVLFISVAGDNSLNASLLPELGDCKLSTQKNCHWLSALLLPTLTVVGVVELQDQGIPCGTLGWRALCCLMLCRF